MKFLVSVVSALLLLTSSCTLHRGLADEMEPPNNHLIPNPIESIAGTYNNIAADTVYNHETMYYMLTGDAKNREEEQDECVIELKNERTLVVTMGSHTREFKIKQKGNLIKFRPKFFLSWHIIAWAVGIHRRRIGILESGELTTLKWTSGIGFVIVLPWPASDPDTALFDEK